MSKNADNFTPPTEHTKAIVRHLLSVSFDGVDALRDQLPTLLVRQIDSEGSLQLKVDPVSYAKTVSSIPVEGSYLDATTSYENTRVHYLLHVRNG